MGRMTVQEAQSCSIAEAAVTGRILKEYPNKDYEVVCRNCKGTGLMPGSSLGLPAFCKNCQGHGFVLVRHSDKKMVAFSKHLR